jgi:hypothetical protein
VAGHQPHPQRPAPQDPPARSLHPPAAREPLTGPLRPLATLRPSATGPHRSKPQEKIHVGVRRPKCDANKNNDKIYQIKQ